MYELVQDKLKIVTHGTELVRYPNSTKVKQTLILTGKRTTRNNLKFLLSINSYVYVAVSLCHNCNSVLAGVATEWTHESVRIPIAKLNFTLTH